MTRPGAPPYAVLLNGGIFQSSHALPDGSRLPFTSERDSIEAPQPRASSYPHVPGVTLSFWKTGAPMSQRFAIVVRDGNGTAVDTSHYEPDSLLAAADFGHALQRQIGCTLHSIPERMHSFCR